MDDRAYRRPRVRPAASRHQAIDIDVDIDIDIDERNETPMNGLVRVQPCAPVSRPIMATRTLDVPGGQRAQLVARLELPAMRSPDAVAIFAHCFTCTKDVRAAVMISRSLADRGIAALRPSMRHKRSRARTVVSIGAPSHTEHALALFAAATDRIAADGSAEVTIAGRWFHVSQSLVDDLREARVLDAARALDRPLLVMHAPEDAVVPINMPRTRVGRSSEWWSTCPTHA